MPNGKSIMHSTTHIRIDVIKDERIVMRFVRKYKVNNDTAHTHAQKWGKSRALEKGLKQFTINTKTMKELCQQQ